MQNTFNSSGLVDITILMPVYNGEAYLRDAIESVLSQTDVKNIEILIINDGSKDQTAEILKSYQDPRLKILHQPNQGLAKTLNVGLNIASGKYIARHDQDDIMLPGRLQKQFQFLEENPEIGMVGTWADIYEGVIASGRVHAHPSDSQVLSARLLFDNPFVHSSIMMRADLIRRIGGYTIDKSRQPPEDYELWSRVARVSKIANLSEILTIYREVPSSMSRIPHNPFLEKILKISAENIHASLYKKYKFEECYSLTCIYHGVPYSYKEISKIFALTMVKEALEGLWGNSLCWTEAMESEAKYLKNRFNWLYKREVMPYKLLAIAQNNLKLVYKRLCP